MIRTIEFESIDSTNDEAKRYVESGGTDSVCFVAKTQTKGRGQGNNIWESSSEDGLYYSLLLQNREFPTQTTLFDDRLLIKTIQNVIESLSSVKTIFKKPNDIYLDSKKLGGVLIESSSHTTTEFKDHVIIGIGLNLNQNIFPLSLDGKAISLHQKTGVLIDKYAVIGLFNLYLDSLFPKL